MVNWITELLAQFVSNQGVNANGSVFEEQHIILNLAGELQLHFDINPQQESLLLTLRLPHRLDDNQLLAQLLQMNHFHAQRPLSPTGHLFDNHIVLRIQLSKAQLTLVNLERALSQMLQVNRELTGF